MKKTNSFKRTICFILAFFLMSGIFTPFLSLATETDNLQNTTQKQTVNTEVEENNVKAEETTQKVQSSENEEKDDEPAPLKKDETVYVNLNPDGSVREQIITDKIHSEKEGTIVKDKSDLKDIEIIKGGELQKNENGNLTWKLDGKDLFYRGKTDKKMPFEMQIKYFLDGKETPAQKLAGKSGKLKITFDFKNNLLQKNTINGKSCEIYSPMVVASVLMMPDETFTNIVAEDCTVTTNGDNTTVVVTCMPGLYKSLNLENSSIDELKDLDFPESFTITADVTNFEMSPIAVTAKSGFPDDDEIDTDFIDDMQEDLNEVKRIKNSFESMDDDRALRDMLTDDEKIEELKSLVDDMDELLDLNKDFIDALPQYLTRKNVDTMERITERMEEFDLRYLKDFEYYDKHEDRAKVNEDTGKGIEAALELADGFNWSAAAKASQDINNIKGIKAILEYPEIDGNTLRKKLNISKKEFEIIKKTAYDITQEGYKIGGELQKRGESGIEGSSLDKAFINADSETKMLVMTLLDPTDSRTIKILKAGIKGAIADNEENIELGKNLIQYYKDPYLRTITADAQYLYDDFIELYPTISKLKHDFEKENMKESFRESPETVKALIRIKDNLEENSDITDNLRRLTEDENVEKTKDIINTLDDFERDRLIDDYSKKADDLEETILRKDLLHELADKNTIHSDYNKDMEADFKFILKTDEIEIPEEEEQIKEKEKKGSPFIDFFKNLFKK